MKQTSRFLSAITLSLLTTFIACKKETTSGSTDNTNELATQADDQSGISVATDAVANDATIAIESTTSFSGSALNMTSSVCDAVITFDTSGATKKMIISYNGANCLGGYTRSGSIVVAMAKGMYWKNAGAVVTITYQNLKVTRTHDKKSITLNGTHAITNVSGGLLINLATLQAITHTLSSSDMSITFDDNTQRTWQVAKQRVFTYDNGVVVTTTGNHAEGSNTGIAVWGSNRFGHAFMTAITQPLVLRQDCNFRLTSGAVKHEGWAVATATFGLDADGNATSCPASGSYHYKLVWTGPAGKSHSSIHPY